MSLTTRRVYDINYKIVNRQDTPIVDLPLSITTSSINPGLPASALPTTNAPALPPALPTTSATGPQLVLSLGSLSPLPSSVDVSSPTSSIAPSTTGTATTPSTGIISITALSPLPSSAIPTLVSHNKIVPESHQKFKLIYLAPVFAIVGVLWGSLTAWFVYGCMTRKPKVVEQDMMVGGPRYVPAPSNEGDIYRDEEEGRSMVQDSVGTFAWPTFGGMGMKDLGRSQRDNPFLAPPPSTPSKSRTKSTRTNRTSKSTRSTRTTASAYSDSTAFMEMFDSEDEEKMKEETVPWESLRHKSIKRGILEQVKKEGNWIDSLRGRTGPSFRESNNNKGTESEESRSTGNQKAGDNVERRPRRHGRTDSDLLLEEVNLQVPDRATLRSVERPASIRTESTQTTSSSGTSPGFRIVDETPATSPVPPQEAYSSMFGASWWGGSANVDRYSPVPLRQSSRSRSSSPLKPTRDRGYSISNHPHAAMLPQSPPQITSPLLHNSLSFTPASASKPRMTPNSRVFRTPAESPTKSSGDANGRGRTLRSVNPPPPPPFLSDPDRSLNSPHPDPFRGRPVKPAARASPQSVRRPPLSTNSSASSASSSSSGKYHREPDGRVVEVPLQKVEEIVERGWGTRKLGEEGMRSLSPTGFGKRVRGG
ncbi:hypothetical protein Hypma_010852 [Hypsizygus marmoreus]|uniref:Uncharacterized protein n=1 Tax=Hypsizygus marmoreus TaxID=39966 RepID=A0A369JK58_HYPMA|nr:hypothetical protein Hypma_010852 [Hypsizygus marmoreus]